MMEYDLKLNQKEKEFIKFVTWSFIHKRVEQIFAIVWNFGLSAIFILQYGYGIAQYMEGTAGTFPLILNTLITLGAAVMLLYFAYVYLKTVDGKESLKNKIKNLK
jgi:hypothetical protein